MERCTQVLLDIELRGEFCGESARKSGVPVTDAPFAFIFEVVIIRVTR